MKPKQIQLGLLRGMEFEYSDEVKVHITLKAEVALDLLRVSIDTNRPMTQIVTELIQIYLENKFTDIPKQTLLI